MPHRPFSRRYPAHHLSQPRAALFALLIATSPWVAASDDQFIGGDRGADAPRSVKPGRAWEEGQVRLPAWPDNANLIEIKTDGAPDPLRYYLDAASLTTGADEVVRYTLVAVSDSGTRNLTFEGLRCTPRGTYKVYAYGDGTAFQPTAIADAWQPIEAAGHVRDELWRHYLCVPRLFEPRQTREQLRLLRAGRVPAHDNTGFIAN